MLSGQAGKERKEWTGRRGGFCNTRPTVPLLCSIGTVQGMLTLTQRAPAGFSLSLSITRFFLLFRFRLPLMLVKLNNG